MKKLIIAIFVLGFFGACAHNYISQSPAIDSKIMAGEVLVKLDRQATAAEKQKFFADFAQVETVDQEDQVFVLRDAKIQDPKDFAADLEELKFVELAEPNFRVKLNNLPQDPYWLKLWGLKNYGQDSPAGIEGQRGADIGAFEAWKTTKGNRNVVVAIIDTGADYTHPDLIDNIWINEKEKAGVPGKDDDGNGYVDDLHGWDAVSGTREHLHYGQVGDPDPMDDQGHGTHVSGTIGAVGGNGIGVVGVNWQVSIMPVKFLDENGSGSTIDEYRAYKYILANKVDVVNGSYGGGGKSRLIESLLKQGGQQGILFVFAAGNDSANSDNDPHYPANYELPNIISVAATDSRDALADFSNFGQKTVHVAAPGVDIYSTVPTTTEDDSGKKIPVVVPYDSYSGTSMASPHVAGAAALLIAADNSLRGQPAEVKKRLIETAEPVAALANMVVARGRISLPRAIANQTQINDDLSGTWEELDVDVKTPSYPQERIDNAWTLNYPKAKAIQVHIRVAQVEADFDAALLYDFRYRPVMNLKGEFVDHWSPIIKGDTVHLKFSNAIVNLDDGKPFANFNSEGVHIDKVRILK